MKNKTSLIITCILLAAAVPFWVGALVNQPPYIQNFTVDERSKLEINKRVIFDIKAFDKEDDELDAVLGFGDGEKKELTLESGIAKGIEHKYQNRGDYKVRLKVTDSDDAITESSFNVAITGEGLEIERFRTTAYSKFMPDRRIYFEYEICAPEEENIEATLYFGDGEKKKIDNFCGRFTTSHKYDQWGDYVAKIVATYGSERAEKTRDIILWPEGNQMPKADFQYSPEDIEAGDRVEFENLSYDRDDVTGITNYQWNFGDGATSNEKNPSHIYNKKGTYKVTLTVTDKGGLEDKKWIYFYVYPRFQSGELVRVPGKQEIWRIRNGLKHWIPTMDVFYDYGYTKDKIEPISPARLASYKRADHVRLAGDSGTIYYITESGLKRELPNLNVFYSYGNKREEIVEVLQKELDAYPEVETVKYNDHWRIYKLEKRNGQIVKRWIKSPQAFEKHNFNWSRIAPINWTEFNAYPTVEAIE